MWDKNTIKKNVCTNLVQITDIPEQIPITDKTHNFYTPPATKKNLHLPQGTNKKLGTNILANTIPLCKDPQKNISHPKQNIYTILTSKINKKAITSSKTTYLRNSNNKPVPKHQLQSLS